MPRMKSPPSYRLHRAQECIGELLALPGPIKIAHTSDNESHEASSEARAAFDQLLAKLRNRAAAAGAPANNGEHSYASNPTLHG